MTLYRVAADVTVVVHLAYAGFVLLGFLAILAGIAWRWSWIRNRWFRGVHLLMIGIVAAEAALGIPCPLTVLENRLRERAGDASYPGSFIGQLANELLFYTAPEWVFTVLYIALFLIVVATLWAAPPRWTNRTMPEGTDAG
jgi:polyferredoxin